MDKSKIKKFILEHRDLVNRIYDDEPAGYILIAKAFKVLSLDEIIALFDKILAANDNSHKYRIQDSDIFEAMIPRLKDLDHAIHNHQIVEEMILDYVETEVDSNLLRWNEGEDEHYDDMLRSFMSNLELMLSKDPTIHILELKASLNYGPRFGSRSGPMRSVKKFKIAVPTSISKSSILNKSGQYYDSLKEVLPSALCQVLIADINTIEVKDIYA